LQDRDGARWVSALLQVQARRLHQQAQLLISAPGILRLSDFEFGKLLPFARVAIKLCQAFSQRSNV
jgi:hypothetical protein